MKLYKLTAEHIHRLADYFAKQDSTPHGISEYDKKVNGYLEIYNAIRSELENYNDTISE